MSSHERVLGFTTVNVVPAPVDGYQVILNKENGTITPIRHEPPLTKCGSTESISDGHNTVNTLTDQSIGLYGVFDDIEGAPVSARVSEVVRDYYYEDLSPPRTLDESLDRVEGALERARQQTYDEGARMAASLVKIEEINGRIYAVWAHAGHSRIYIYTKESELIQLTKDQKVFNRAVNWVGSGVSGVEDVVNYVELRPEDRIMLCNSSVTDRYESREFQIKDFKTALASSSEIDEQSEHFLSHNKTEGVSKAVVLVKVEADREGIERSLGSRFDRLKIFNGRSLFVQDDDLQYGYITGVQTPGNWKTDKKRERLKNRSIVAGIGAVVLAAAVYVLGHSSGNAPNDLPRLRDGGSATPSEIVDRPPRANVPRVRPSSQPPKEVSIKVSAGGGITHAIDRYAKEKGSDLTPEQLYAAYQYLDTRHAINDVNTYRMINGDLGVKDKRRGVRLNLKSLKEAIKSLKRGFKQ